jgi:hypothetical protein
MTRSMTANTRTADPAVKAYAHDVYRAASKAGLHKGADLRALWLIRATPENPFLGARVGIVAVNYSVDLNGKFTILNLTNSPSVTSSQIRHVRAIMADAGRELKPLPDDVKSILGDLFTDWMIFDWHN